jgi:hypothetical protein
MTKPTSHVRRVLAAAIALQAVAGPALGEASQIQSISAPCGVEGDQVTITGNGFGASNVRVSVGGVAARVVTANGNSATFVVPATSTVGPTTVTETNPGGQSGSIGFAICDVRLPPIWAGEWKIDITYRDAVTGRVTATESLPRILCAGSPLGLGQLLTVDPGSCSSTVSGSRLLVSCSASTSTGGCSLRGSLRLAVDLPPGPTVTLHGSGAWSGDLSPGCPLVGSRGETIEITGVRTSDSQARCSATSPPVATGFLGHFPFLLSMSR